MAIPAVIKKLIESKYGKTLEKSGVRYRVLVDATMFKARADTAKKLAADIGGKVSPDGKSVSANGITYEIKPASLQGTASSGVTNEHNLVAAINYVIQNNGRNEPINILFTNGTKKYLIKGAVSASSAGSDTANRKKSDVNIQTRTGARPINLKQDNAEYWESADTMWGKTSLPFLQGVLAEKRANLIQQASGEVFVEPNIAIEATDEEARDAVFGSDILLMKGAVITRTFVGEDFTWDGATETLTINCSSVITTLQDIPAEKKVFFLIRNASGRKSIPGYPGLRVMAAYKSRITGKTVVIKLQERYKYK